MDSFGFTVIFHWMLLVMDGSAVINLRKNTDSIVFLNLDIVCTILSIVIGWLPCIVWDESIRILAFSVLIIRRIDQSGRTFRVRSWVLSDSKIYRVCSRGKTFIFIFFFNVINYIRTGVHPCLPIQIGGSVASTASIRLTLSVTLSLHLASLNELPLGLHELIELFAGLGCHLSYSLGWICSFDSISWVVGIANPFTRPLSAIWRRFSALLTLVLGSISTNHYLMLLIFVWYVQTRLIV